MDQTELKVEPGASLPDDRGTAQSSHSRPPVAPRVPEASVLSTACPMCAATTSEMTYIYAIGKIYPRFPDLSVEKEFAQATGRAETAGLTDREALQGALSAPENRYLVRHLRWVVSIGGTDTYLLIPQQPNDYSALIEALRPKPQPGDLDVVIGTRGPMAPPDYCNGLIVPIVAFDQIYSFDRDALIKAIPRPERIPVEEFDSAAEELFDRVMQMAGNAGQRDEDRAVNYLMLRYPAIYAAVAEAHVGSKSLTAVDVKPSALAGVRKMVDVIISFTHRTTGVVDKLFVRVDVTAQFPFLATRLSPYFDR